MAFAQLTCRNSLRDIETCLRAQSGKLDCGFVPATLDLQLQAPQAGIVAPVRYPDHQDAQDVVLDASEDPAVASPVPPSLRLTLKRSARFLHHNCFRCMPQSCMH